MATLVERVTRLTLLIKVSNRKSQLVIPAIVRRMGKYVVKSITWDHGNEAPMRTPTEYFAGSYPNEQA